MKNTSTLRLFVTPSLKITGGNLEIIRLARELSDQNVPVRLVAMWRTPYEADTSGLTVNYLSDAMISPWIVLIQLPFVMASFRRLLSNGYHAAIFSHYVTFALCWMASRRARWFFVQDTEWLFVNNTAARTTLKHAIVATLRQGNVLSANPYLTGQMAANDVPVVAEAPIWADPRFGSNSEGSREIDVIVMLRRGAHKRADLTLLLIEQLLNQLPGVRLAAISPDETYRTRIPQLVRYVERPTLAEMRALYENTKVFVLMSDHEGFGLPPLEAMGAGCVPVCRDAGGVRSYMTGELSRNVVPLDGSISDVVDAVSTLLNDEVRQSRLSKIARDIFVRGQETASWRVPALLAAGL